ncbi:MAG: LysR substrate-binding domain-containing protein [Cyanobacteria bacterium P01_F01_bin.150]
MNIELRQMRYFVAVAEELNFTRAAERLQIAQPPLSRQVQALEQSLGIMLLERTNRKVALTPAGAVFLEECRQVLAQVERSVSLAQQVAHGETGKLVVGFEGAAHNELILKIIRQFRAQFPNVDLVMQEMASGKQVDALERRKIDVGLIEPIASRDDIELMALLSEPLMVAMYDHHPLARERTVDLYQLANEDWVTGQRNSGCGLLLRILDACHQAGFTPKIQQETNDLQMTLGFVASGLGVTLLPESRALPKEGVVYRPVQPPIADVQLAIAWWSGRRSPVVDSFLQIAEAHIEESLKRKSGNNEHAG